MQIIQSDNDEKIITLATNVLCNILTLNHEIAAALYALNVIPISAALYHRSPYSTKENLLYAFANLSIDSKDY